MLQGGKGLELKTGARSPATGQSAEYTHLPECSLRSTFHEQDSGQPRKFLAFLEQGQENSQDGLACLWALRSWISELKCQVKPGTGQVEPFFVSENPFCLKLV
jgi:hypothetical protein